MSTWEERMAAQSREKGRTQAQAEKRQQQASDDEYDRIHGTHHTHLQGTGVYCSCGEFRGVTCVAFPGEWAAMTDEEIRAEVDALRCVICGEPGVVHLGG